MIIPKEFEGLQDLEAMLLTSMLGTFEALKEDLISIQQAESYWLSDFTAELFEEMKLSREIISLIQEGVQLKDLQQFSQLREPGRLQLPLRFRELPRAQLRVPWIRTPPELRAQRPSLPNPEGSRMNLQQGEFLLPEPFLRPVCAEAGYGAPAGRTLRQRHLHRRADSPGGRQPFAGRTVRSL